MAINKGMCFVGSIFLLLGELHAQTNLAFNKSTSMYDDRHGVQAAVDGSPDCVERYLGTILGTRCYCDRTVISTGAWWAVDLQDVSTISSVVITTNLGDAELMTPSICVLNSMPIPQQEYPELNTTVIACEQDITTIAANSTQTVAVNLEGQYLTIIAGNNLIDICEVEVYGSSAQDTTTAVVDEAEVSVPSGQSSSVYYSVTSGARINSVVLDTAVVASQLQCALKCMRRADCENFNYKANGNVCEWLSQSEPLSEVAESDWIYATEIN